MVLRKCTPYTFSVYSDVPSPALPGEGVFPRLGGCMKRAPWTKTRAVRIGRYAFLRPLSRCSVNNIPSRLNKREKKSPGQHPRDRLQQSTSIKEPEHPLRHLIVVDEFYVIFDHKPILDIFNLFLPLQCHSPFLLTHPLKKSFASLLSRLLLFPSLWPLFFDILAPTSHLFTATVFPSLSIGRVLFLCINFPII